MKVHSSAFVNGLALACAVSILRMGVVKAIARGLKACKASVAK